MSEKDEFEAWRETCGYNTDLYQGVLWLCWQAARAAQAVQALTEPVAWGLRIGDSDVWSYTTTEADADFWGKESGLRYEKRPLYAAPQPSQEEKK